NRQLYSFGHALGVRERLAGPPAPVVFGQPNVRDAFFRAKLRSVVDPPPFEEFLAAGHDRGQQRQTPAARPDVFGRAAFEERHHLRRGLDPVGLHDTPREVAKGQQRGAGWTGYLERPRRGARCGSAPFGQPAVGPGPWLKARATPLLSPSFPTPPTG